MTSSPKCPVLDPFSDAPVSTEAPAAPSSRGEEKSHADAPFHRMSKPTFGRITETPLHREVGFLTLKGHTQQEIADILGIAVNTVFNTQRLPWVKQLMVDEIRNAGRRSLTEILDEQMPACLQKLIDLRDNAESQEVQRKAANDLLNRRLGMPGQKIEHSTDTDPSRLSDDELAAIVTKAKGN
jgi:hypothetical protein